MSDKWRELERLRDKEDELTEIQFLSEQARIPGRVGWLAERRRRFLLEGKAPIIEPQPWFDDVIEEQLKHWLKVGLSCEPANRQAAEQVASRFYGRLGKETPKFVWFQSPLEANQAILETRNPGTTQLEIADRLWYPLVDQLEDQLCYQLEDLSIQLLDNLSNLNYQIRDQLWDQLWDQLRDRLVNQLGILIIDTNLWGSLDAYWISYYMAVRELGVCYQRENLELLREWDVLTHSCFLWWPYDEVCFISDRPQEIQFRKDDTFKKCIFRDGWGVDNG